MGDTTVDEETERPDLLKIRDNLVVSRQTHRGSTYYVIKEPIRRTYFRLREFEYLLIQEFDGVSTLEDIQKKVEDKYRKHIPLEQLEAYAQRLADKGLFEGSGPAGARGRLVWGLVGGGSLVHKILHIRVSVFDPDRILNRVVARISAPATRFLAGGVITTVIAGVLVVALSWGDFVGGARDLRWFTGGLILELVLLVWLIRILLILGHESSHAFACKYFGGEVHEVGFLLLFLLPCFYCNLSDAWMFSTRRKKLMVYLAGPIFDAFAGAVAALVWRLAPSGMLISQVALLIAVVCGIRAILNFNPLIRLDGYYALSDLLEIPNLRAHSFGYLKSLVRTKIFRRAETPESIATRDKTVYLSYGVLSALYSIVFFGYLMPKFFLPVLRGMGGVRLLVLALLLAVFVVGVPLLGKLARAAFSRGTANPEEPGDAVESL